MLTAADRHRELEGFLTGVVERIKPNSTEVRWVVVHPNYGNDTVPEHFESGDLANQLKALIFEEALKAGPGGYGIAISENHASLLRKYIRKITLYSERQQSEPVWWIQVWPPCYDGEGKIINR